MALSEFKPGEMVVYPTHGVAEMVSVEHRELAGTKAQFYVLKIVESGLKVMVPVKNAGTVGIRNLVSKEEIDEIYEMLQSREVPRDNQTWNRRSREYEEKINTGSLYEIAELVRDLRVLGARKELSFGEKRVLAKAKKRMVKEIATVKKLSDDDTTTEVDAIFADIPLKVPPS